MNWVVSSEAGVLVAQATDPSPPPPEEPPPPSGRGPAGLLPFAVEQAKTTNGASATAARATRTRSRMGECLSMVGGRFDLPFARRPGQRRLPTRKAPSQRSRPVSREPLVGNSSRQHQFPFIGCKRRALAS